MAAFPTIVPTVDLQKDKQRQDQVAMQAENRAAQQKLNDALETHAKALNDQVMAADRAQAQQTLNAGIDQGASRINELAGQQADESSPFGFQGFSKAFDGFLQARTAPPAASAASTPGPSAPAVGSPAAAPQSPSLDGTPHAATLGALSAGALPSDLQFAQTHLDSQDYINLCEKFVENANGRTGEYPTALAALQAAQSSGDANANVQQAPKGSVVYYGPAAENGGAGHAAISNGDGTVTSATSSGVRTTPLTAFQAQPVAWVPASFLSGGSSGSAAGLGGADDPTLPPPLEQDAQTIPSAEPAPVSQTPDASLLPTAAPPEQYSLHVDAAPTPAAPPEDPAAKLASTGPEGQAVVDRLFGPPTPQTAPAAPSTAPSSDDMLAPPQPTPQAPDPNAKIADLFHQLGDAIGGLQPGARTPNSPTDAIQNAAAAAGVPIAPDITGQQPLPDLMAKEGESMQHRTVPTPFGLFNPQLAPPTPGGGEDLAPASRVLDENAPHLVTGTPGGGILQQGLDMLDRQAKPQDVTGDTLGLKVQRAVADRFAAANAVGGNALKVVNDAEASGNLLPEEAAAIRDSVNAEAKLSLIAGSPQAAAQRVDDNFRPIYQLVQGKTFVDDTGQTRPLTDAVDMYAKYKTDQDRLASGSRMSSAGVNGPADAAQGIREIQAATGADFPLVQQANEMRQGAIDQLRQDFVKAGMLSQKDANTLAREYPNYNPVHYAEYYNDQMGGGHGGRRLDQSNNMISSLTEEGSPMDTQPALQSAMQAVFQGDIAIRRNDIGQTIIQAAKLDPQMAGLIKPVEAEDPALAAQISKMKGMQFAAAAQGTGSRVGIGPSDANTITFFQDGQRQVWQVPKVLADVTNGLTQPQASGLSHFLGALNAPIRTLSTTLSPTFVLSRAVWNAGWGWVRTGQTPWDQVGGMVSVAKNDPKYQQFIALGGGLGRTEVGATDPGIGRAMQTTGQSLEKLVTRSGGFIIKDRGETNMGATLANLFSGAPIRRANEIINMGPRVAEFGRQQAKDATDIEGAMTGRRVVTDFARGGQLSIELSNPMLFLNDHIRGILDVGRTLRDDPTARIRLGVLTGATVGAFFWNRQFGDQIDDVPDYVKNGALVFMLPGSTMEHKQYVALPLRNLAAPAIAANAVLNHLQNSGNDQALGQIGWSILGSFSPVPGAVNSGAGMISNLASGLLGGVPKTALEEVANRDFFRNQPIVPQHMIDQNTPAPEQVTPGTSNIAKAIAAGLGKIPGMPAEWTSPKRIDYALASQTGSAGRLVMEAADTLTGKPSDTPPVIGGLLGGVYKTTGGQQEQDFYDKIQAANEQSARITEQIISGIKATPAWNKMTPGQQAVALSKIGQEVKMAVNLATFGNKDPSAVLAKGRRGTQMAPGINDQQRQEISGGVQRSLRESMSGPPTLSAPKAG